MQIPTQLGAFWREVFPNLLSSDAVDYFIKCTHEEYFKRFGSCFGTVIKGMFTDEPSIGYCCESDSIPYYEGIEADYFELCGRDFNSDMRECKGDFYTNAINVISSRFNRCYISKIELVTEAYVPHGATAIELSGTRLYTLVYANGVLLGEERTTFGFDKIKWIF